MPSLVSVGSSVQQAHMEFGRMGEVGVGEAGAKDGRESI